jgi:dTDP-4-amino-4,6-dideoxygalactose transaminase
MLGTPDRLALLGGTPVRSRPWPKWPRASANAQRSILEALHSGKWAISGVGESAKSYESQFGAAFARFAGRKFGIPCSSGTSALTIALQALDIGPGDCVVVPGLTWVACASAVLNLGAVPILCDVDPDSLCASPAELDTILARSTDVRAVVMAHMYGSVCDIDGFIEVTNRHRIPLIEDGSQAHGGQWRGKPIGSFGVLSAFSLQHSKLLTCGEGGIAVTDDADLNLRLQEFRADGRVYSEAASELRHRFHHELRERGSVVGRNLCLSDFQAAIALDGLLLLDDENAIRTRTAAYLSRSLRAVSGARLSACPDAVDVRPYYRVAIRLADGFAGRAPIEAVAAALSAELNTDVKALDAPLDRNPLYRPQHHPFVRRLDQVSSTLARVSAPLPKAHRAYATTVTLPHQILLSADEDMDGVTAALAKIQSFAAQDEEWHRSWPGALSIGEVLV